MIKTLDLQESLAKWIHDNTGIPVKIDFLSPGSHVGLIPNTGSHVVNAEMDGTQHWQYNYAIAMKADDPEVVKNKLFTIQNALEQMTSLPSQNGSFVFEKVEVSSAPSATLVNIQGTAVYEVDFAVFVYPN